jgi:hypothetical protein
MLTLSAVITGSSIVCAGEFCNRDGVSRFDTYPNKLFDCGLRIHRGRDVAFESLCSAPGVADLSLLVL